MFRPSRCVKVIVSSFVLHNICVTRNVNLDEEQNVVEEEINEQENDDDGGAMDPLNLRRGRAVRQRLIEQFM